MSDTETLQTLLDRQAITDVIYRYSRAMDRMDVELGYSLFHDDAVVDYGDFYQGPAREVIDRSCAQHEKALCHSHQMTGIVIELNGDSAGSETYQTTNVRFEQDGDVKQITIWGRYIDTWSKRNGRWAMDKRIALQDFDEIRDVTPLTSHEKEGRRDRSDVSYTVLKK